MKNNLIKLIKIIFVFFVFTNTFASDQFNFDVTEIQILENGNRFIGTKRGTISTDDGIIINADNFEYDKSLNILNASGKVKINDKVNNYLIFTDEITYKKNLNQIFTKGNSKAINLNDNTLLTAENFEYFKNENIIIAKSKVEFEDKDKDYKLFSEYIKYNKSIEKIITEGKTSAIIQSKYNFNSKDVVFFRNSMELSSNKKTTLSSEANLYHLKKFKYIINQKELKGEKIVINTNYKKPKSDKFYFENAIINLESKNFVAKDTKINLHKGIFDNQDNDPRIEGISSNKNDNITIINKGVFTSCKERDGCPPWIIEAKEIKHDTIKKQLTYKDALLKVYDIPILYFPKFFHPDPTVERQSGLLKPVLNKSNILGTSYILPYYHVISNDSDITTTPVFFENSTMMIQNEYRKVGENYEFLTNFGHTRGYKSSTLNRKKNISYLFTKLDVDLGLDDFEKSKMFLNVEKTTNDTFLKVFDTNLIENTSSLKPDNKTSLQSDLSFVLNHKNYNLSTGIQSFENLQERNNDRYQYILPYYDFDKIFFPNFKYGLINFTSSGDNNLSNTNQIKSKIVNNATFSSMDYFSNYGIRNNFNINLKNLNSVGKNVVNYKSSPQIELSSIFELKSTLPMLKESENYLSYLTPKISLRANPGDMKNYSNSERRINTGNIFSLTRLGLEDSFEEGKSITLGLDYKKELLQDINNYFELNLATVFRDKEQPFIPSKTTLHKKNSNLFGSATYNFPENIKINYNFAIDNNFNQIEYNEIEAMFAVNNFVTNFNYTKEIGEMGEQDFIQNSTSIEIDGNNQLTFSTRRNRKLNLTEFYDLVYEYKNDCLTAGIKYKKTYYEDRDLKPTEDLLFTITLFPLTTYETRVNEELY